MLSIIGIVLGLCVGIFAGLSLFLVSEQNYLVGKKNLHMMFWGILLVVSICIFLVSLFYFLATGKKYQEAKNFNHLKKTIEFHEKSIRPQKGVARGCSDSEIEYLEKYFGFELPISYKQYLKFMGKDYQGIFKDQNWFIDTVIENTKNLSHLIKNSQIEDKFSDDYLAFYSNQNNLFVFFVLPKTSENPRVWIYDSENDSYLEKIESFTDFLFDEMKRLTTDLK